MTDTAQHSGSTGKPLPKKNTDLPDSNSLNWAMIIAALDVGVAGAAVVARMPRANKMLKVRTLMLQKAAKAMLMLPRL